MAAYAKDSARSYNYVLSPGKLKGNIIADKTRGINSLNVNFSTFVIAENTNNLYFRWDFDNDGNIDSEGWLWILFPIIIPQPELIPLD
jgi:PKD repeat protein